MQGDRFDLAVVGAGLNGSLLALAAGEAGLDTVLIDRVPLTSLTDAGFDGRTCVATAGRSQGFAGHPAYGRFAQKLTLAPRLFCLFTFPFLW